MLQSAKKAIWISFFTVIFCSGTAMASPWAEAGDRQLRSDIELLSRHGLIRGPVTAWPIPWKQITARLSVDPAQPMPPSARAALYRVYDKMPKEEEVGHLRFGIDGKAASDAKIGRDFGSSARDKIDGRVSAELSGSSLSGRLSVGYQGDIDGAGPDHLAFDDSYLAAALGNWMIYGGWLDRWWGPAWSSSSIFSSNARPLPSVGLMRMDPKPFDSRWLSWLGPWQLNVTFGLMDDDDRFIKNPYLLGLRLTINPARNLEIGLNRTLMICGKEQRCGFSTWTHALIGVGNLDNLSGGRDASNQLGGFDIKYGFDLGKGVFMASYLQMSGEDENAFLPFKFSGVGGFSLDGPWGRDGASWRVIAEYSDTLAFLSPGRQYNVTYNHFRYRSGYRYHDQAIGDRWDGDSKAVYLSGLFTDKDGWGYRVAIQHARVNLDGAGRNGVSLSREIINLLEGGLTIPAALGPMDGSIAFTLWAQDDSPDTPGRKDGKAGIEVNWKASF